jgi:hypothetical protein
MTKSEASINRELQLERESETRPGQRMLLQRFEYLKGHASGFNHIREMAAEIERLQGEVESWKSAFGRTINRSDIDV